MDTETGSDVTSTIEPRPDGDLASAGAPPLPQHPGAPPGRHTLRTVLLTIGAVLAVLTLVGMVVEYVGASGPIFREDFSSEDAAFPIESDPTVDLAVVDDSYRVSIKDDRGPQIVRHAFDRTYGGVSVRATGTFPAGVGRGAILSIGCWNGDSGYLFVTRANGDTGLIETVSEATGERREISELVHADVARPTGRPNRIRIDCVGGGEDPTAVTGYVNGERIVSAEIPHGWDSFTAIGFFLWAPVGSQITIDDASAWELPESGAAQPEEAAGVSEACDRVFADAEAARSAGDGTAQLDIVGLQAPKACRSLAEAEAASVDHSGEASSEGLEEYLARSCAYVGPSAGIRDTDLCREVLAMHPELG